MKQFTATANDEGVRLSRFVQSVTRDLPTSLLYKSFRNKRVKVNGKKGAPEDRLKAGDLIELYINDEFFPPEGAKPAARKPAPKKQQNQPKVTVIYEDENIAVLYKPTHLLCHSDRTGDANLVDAFTQYLAQKGEYDAGGENRFKPSPWASPKAGGSRPGGSTTKRTTRSASMPTNLRMSAASRSSPMWTCCAPPGPLPCAGLAWSRACLLYTSPSPRD